MDQIEEKKTNKRKKKKGLSASAWLAQARGCREPTHPCLFFLIGQTTYCPLLNFLKKKIVGNASLTLST